MRINQAALFRHGFTLIVGFLLLANLNLGCAAGPSPTAPVWPDELITTSERSEYHATETHGEVVELLDRIAARSPIATRATLGRSVEGRELPLLILADPPVTSAAEAHASGKLIVYLQGSIHGGEVDGKPALIQLARELALTPRSPDRRLLDNMILVMCPVYNADGNDRIKPGNRGRAQNGPALGMGERANAQGLDLNRDHIKLDSPEAQALATFLTEWNPHLTIDTHTTNGSLHQYALTYAAPQNPTGHSKPIEFTRDTMLPEVTSRLEKRTGLKTFFYGNFDKAHTTWATYSHEPRFATPYRGLRNRLSILTEAYAYSTYRQRVTATREFIRETLRYASRRRNDIVSLLEQAEQETRTAPKGESGDPVGIRYTIAKFDHPVTIPSYETVIGEYGEPADGITSNLKPHAYVVDHFGRYEATRHVMRPYAYALPATLTAIVDKLRQHGVRIEPLDRAAVFDTEAYIVESVTRAPREFQGRLLTTVEATATREQSSWPAGTWIVPMDQPLANLAIYLLEPESDDGLTTWGFFDETLAVGSRFPVARVMQPIGR